jgi:hypothetical protein
MASPARRTVSNDRSNNWWRGKTTLVKKEYRVRVAQTLNISPLITNQFDTARLGQFLDHALPEHLESLREMLNREKWVLHQPLPSSYVPSTSSRYSVTRADGVPVEIALFTEMVRFEGDTTYWQTSVMTGKQLDDWLASGSGAVQ